MKEGTKINEGRNEMHEGRGKVGEKKTKRKDGREEEERKRDRQRKTARQVT